MLGLLSFFLAVLTSPTYNQTKWGDRHVYARFIPTSIHDAFDRRHSSERASGPEAEKPKLYSKIDIVANVGRMWR
jgi:hypothetical protein